MWHWANVQFKTHMSAVTKRNQSRAGAVLPLLCCLVGLSHRRLRPTDLMIAAVKPSWASSAASLGRWCWRTWSTARKPWRRSCRRPQRWEMSQDSVRKWKFFLLNVQLVATQECIYHRTSCCPFQKACLTVEENIRLKSRLQVAEAEAGQRQASSAEQDYEEVIQLLEAEIRDLKNQLASKRQARGVEAAKVRLKHLLNYFSFYIFSLCSNTFQRDNMSCLYCCLSALVSSFISYTTYS